MQIFLYTKRYHLLSISTPSISKKMSFLLTPISSVDPPPIDHLFCPFSPHKVLCFRFWSQITPNKWTENPTFADKFAFLMCTTTSLKRVNSLSLLPASVPLPFLSVQRSELTLLVKPLSVVKTELPCLQRTMVFSRSSSFGHVQYLPW